MRIGTGFGAFEKGTWEIDKATVGAHKSPWGIRANKVRNHLSNTALGSVIGWERHGHHDEKGTDSMADLTEKLHEASDEVDLAEKRFMESRTRFASNIKNEIASIEASSKKVTAEFNRIATALTALTAVYTSGTFVSAVENAERLAIALSSLQKLNNSKLTFAVIDNSQSKE